MESKIKNNIWKFYLYRIFCCFIFASPIFILFLVENGLSMTRIMILQSFYNAIIMIGVVPAGIFADKYGRKNGLILSQVFFFSGFLFYGLSSSFLGFIFSEAILALSAAFWFTSGTSFFYDTLKNIGQEKRFKNLFGNVISINYLFWGISSLIGGYLAVKSLRLTFILSSIGALLGFFVALTFKEPMHGKKKITNPYSHLKDAFIYAKNHPKIRFFIIYTAITFCVWFSMLVFFQPRFKELNIPLSYFGWMYLGFYLVGALGSKFASSIENILGEKKTLLTILVLLIVSFIGMVLNMSFMIIFPFIIFFTIGLYEPVLSDYFNKNIKSHNRATVLSLNTLISQTTVTAIGPIFGIIADLFGLKWLFFTGAVILVPVFFLVLVYFKK